MEGQPIIGKAARIALLDHARTAIIADALADDLNTPAALAELHKLAQTAGSDSVSRSVLKASANALGLLTKTQTERRLESLAAAAIDVTRVETLMTERAAARANKDWKESDRIRDQLLELGVAVKDSKSGATWELRR